MSRHELDGPARKKLRSLVTALDSGSPELIQHRWAMLARAFNGALDKHRNTIRELLTDEQIAKLTEITSIKL